MSHNCQINPPTSAYAAPTPPNPATFICIRSMPRRTAAIAHAGMGIGIGIRVSLAAGFENMIEKISPRRIESLPQYGREYP